MLIQKAHTWLTQKGIGHTNAKFLFCEGNIYHFLVESGDDAASIYEVREELDDEIRLGEMVLVPTPVPGDKHRPEDIIVGHFPDPEEEVECILCIHTTSQALVPVIRSSIEETNELYARVGSYLVIHTYNDESRINACLTLLHEQMPQWAGKRPYGADPLRIELDQQTGLVRIELKLSSDLPDALDSESQFYSTFCEGDEPGDHLVEGLVQIGLAVATDILAYDFDGRVLQQVHFGQDFYPDLQCEL